PKEDKIAVALAANPLIDEQIMFRKVHIVDLKTGQAANLNNPGKLGQLAWSPDGKKLAMITGVDKHDPKEGQLWITHDQKKLTSIWPWGGTHVESVAWRSKSAMVVQTATGVQSHVVNHIIDIEDPKSLFKSSPHRDT